MNAFVLDLECTRCGKRFAADRPQTVCPDDGGSFFVRYDLAAIRARSPRPAALALSPDRSMWRYADVLPTLYPVTLGEGQTPLLRAKRLGARYRTEKLYVKDEGLNPTGSFKARGMSAAVSMAREFGLKKLAAPTAGNAGSALAAYAAAAGIEAHIFAPSDVPRANIAEYRSYGARVTLVDGLINECARKVQEGTATQGWFDVSTMKEPYRVEGKKTMGYEVAEQLGWKLPDVILYPTGGGVGLIGMWKAFEEMGALGWIRGKERPRMVVVQSTGCAPVVRAFEKHAKFIELWAGAQTYAAGLRVPKPYADDLIMKILQESRGTAIAVPDERTRCAVELLGKSEGIFASPEGGAAVAALDDLYGEGWIHPDETVVVYNTGSGLKYL